MAPLVTVDRAELAVFIGPFVPDLHAALLQPAHVGVAGDEPEQLVDDRLQVQFLGREQREAPGEVEAHLRAEDRQGPGAGPVGLPGATREHMREEIEVLAFAGGQGGHMAM